VPEKLQTESDLVLESSPQCEATRISNDKPKIPFFEKFSYESYHPRLIQRNWISQLPYHPRVMINAFLKAIIVNFNS
jgi:hypothetical protein